ncbi:hypothetical protein FACS1894216_03780 [Synergistales bacterium]|nr:hypothetical protein FACS1894216_03780 [Synergistales bacterium]
MNDQYVDDVGDFIKLGILRALCKNNVSIGVNWYWTPNDPVLKDGGHIAYLLNPLNAAK